MENTNTPNHFPGLSDALQLLTGSTELTLQVLDLIYAQSPIPVEVFDPDGTTIYVNQAGLDMTGCKDASLLVGKYNLLHDPVCNEIMGHEVIEKAFRGEPVTYLDFPAPIQDVKDRGVIDEKPWEAATMDLTMAPIWNDGKFLCTICTFIIKHIYYGRAEVADAKKYIEEHWLEPYDEQAVAKAVHVSRAHLRDLFGQSVGMTMHNYYKKIKVDHIKEKLRDTNLNVAQVFHTCGADSRGQLAKDFKKLTGMTPKEYQESLK